jgi:Rrf2 family protein
MKINTKIRYGLRAMIELALADQEKGMLQKEIARNQCISEKYLDHIISALKVSRLIKNVKGKKSGYRLTRDVDSITVNDIFLAFDSKLVDLECFDDVNICDRVDQCAAKDFWSEYESAIQDFLMSVTLKKLAGDEVKKRGKNNPDGMYYI